MIRHEQGWYFPRDGHPEQDLTRTYDSSSSDKPPPTHGISYTANYSNYNGLLHGYYDARTGTQMSPSVINYPVSVVGASETTDDTPGRNRFRPTNNFKARPKATNESHPIYANHPMLSHDHSADPNWFTPHFRPQNTPNDHTSTISPISLSYDREQEIVLKPTMPRHSSMKPSIQVPADDVHPPFDPGLSVVRENSISSAVDQVEYDFSNANEYPYTNGWVESQAPPFHSRQSLQSHSNTYRQNDQEHPSKIRGYHTLAPNSRVAFYPTQQSMVPRNITRDRGSSVSSSVNEIRAHYNRDRLLGTVERVRSTSSRSRRPGSFASLSSEQLSPQLNGYVHSPLPPPYHLTECYPELVSPVYYNNNNNRHSDPSAPAGGNYQPPRSSSYIATSPHYENSGLLTSTNYRAPAFPHPNIADQSSKLGSSANVTSGLGSSWSQSRIEGNQRRARPSWSHSSAPTPYEYDISCESSPAVILPQFSSTSNSRYFGLYAQPKYVNSQTSQMSQSWKTRYHPKASYDPSFITSNYNQPPMKTFTPRSSRKQTMHAPSDSVDENYEFDPILIDSEPQDFFHINSVDMPEAVESESSSSQGMRRLSLYAEQPTPPATRNSQRFSRLRDEYNTFRERQSSASQPMALSRLESDIL